MILVYFQSYDTPVELVNHWTFLFRLKTQYCNFEIIDFK